MGCLSACALQLGWHPVEGVPHLLPPDGWNRPQHAHDPQKDKVAQIMDGWINMWLDSEEKI